MCDIYLFTALGVYIYTMADIVLHMDIEDANITTVSDLVDIIIQQKNLGLSRVAKNVFTIWMKSNVLGNDQTICAKVNL